MKADQQQADQVVVGLDRHEVESALHRLEVLAAVLAQTAGDEGDLPAAEQLDRTIVLADLLAAEIKRETFRLGIR